MPTATLHKSLHKMPNIIVAIHCSTHWLQRIATRILLQRNTLNGGLKPAFSCNALLTRIFTAANHIPIQVSSNTCYVAMHCSSSVYCNETLSETIKADVRCNTLFIIVPTAT